MIDSHCHLDFSCFDYDRELVLENCKKLAVDTIVIPGTQANQWQNQIDLCHLNPQLRFALGLHPYFLNQFTPSDLGKLTRLLEQHSKKVVALGEIGLDTHIDVDWQLQKHVFEQQLTIAKNQLLPVILHQKKR